MNIDPNSLRFLAVGQVVEPCDYKVAPISLDFTATNQYTLNLQNMQSRDFVGMIRALWVDNGLNSSILFINNPVSNQTVQVPPLSQGYVSVLCPNPASFVFTSAGNVITQVQLLNYEITDIFWTV